LKDNLKWITKSLRHFTRSNFIQHFIFN